MSIQNSRLAAALVDRMIRRTLRSRFRTVLWTPPPEPIPQPCILVPNHHGWHDGYVMYVVAKALNLPVVDWIAEFEAFPLFASVGGLPFSPHRPEVRAATILKTVRLLRSGAKNLVLFAEGDLHRPPEIWPLGESLEFLCRKVPVATVIPVGIRYEMSIHERPDCIVVFGDPTKAPDVTADLLRHSLAELLRSIDPESPSHKALLQGTLDVNERWDMRKAFRKHHD